MSRKHTIANKIKWSKVSKEIKSKRMSQIARKKQLNYTTEERIKMGRKLNSYRWKPKILSHIDIK